MSAAPPRLTTPLLVVYSGPRDLVHVVADALGAQFVVRWVPPEDDSVAKALPDAVVFLDASMRVRITTTMVDDAPDLRLVVTATTGADHIDGVALARRGIPLVTLKGQTEVLNGLTPAAEHSWLLLLACARSLPAARAHVIDAGWDRVRFPGVMLRGRALGIIGCGRIGQWMARYGHAFGMVCRGYDPYLTDWPEHLTRTDLRELLAVSDFVTLHVHLTDATRGLLRREHFEAMKPGAVFVNTSRGELIDETALLDALRSGQLRAAGLDVLTGEPDVADHALRCYAVEHSNLIITPHIGGYSPDAVATVLRFSAERIRQHFGRAR
jgi:phosphoglycerate dehydrogenase-like enzyme